jgi:hypothetical protein
MEIINNTQVAHTQVTKQDVIEQIKKTMKKVDPTAKVILHKSAFHSIADDMDKIIDLVVVLDKDQQRLSLDEEHVITDPLGDIEDNLDYQYCIFPIVVPKTQWVSQGQPTYFYREIMDEDGVVLC